MHSCLLGLLSLNSSYRIIDNSASVRSLARLPLQSAHRPHDLPFLPNSKPAEHFRQFKPSEPLNVRSRLVVAVGFGLRKQKRSDSKAIK